MKANNFIFADLSTFDTTVAKQFYMSVFGWSFIAADGYYSAHLNNKEICGLYETPQKFKAINMPSFWMSYIQVNSIATTVTKAKALGGIIELVEDNSIGKVALIRDPLGAGFTIYQGNTLNSRFSNTENTLVWNELFISDISKVKSFYQGIFNWSFEATNNDRCLIKNNTKETIGAIQEISNDIKGNKEYWSVYFGVKHIEKTKELAINNGGKLLYEDESMTVIEDPFGAFFHIIQIKHTEKEEKTSFRWKSILGLSLIVLSLLTGWYWIWGIFFALWVGIDIRSGFTHLLEPISKRDSPILYWVIITLWIVLSIYSFLYYF